MSAWITLLFIFTVIAIVVCTVTIVRKLNRIDRAVETANGILLGGLAERQEADIVDRIPQDQRTLSQQGYVDRRDASDAADLTRERKRDFDRGDNGGDRGRSS